ncbi:hypothetical protein HPB47_025977 [Ixodes persulcatus]|uniref:Uncharacterized protein n=1 Tax=Ixodes persulcatus TaxID=34615 RepID=A0AC60Q0P4_IXOPE|nr:hypothetical protein HPB47_025977 [Ixodes persulcatus]
MHPALFTQAGVATKEPLLGRREEECEPSRTLHQCSATSAVRRIIVVLATRSTRRSLTRREWRGITSDYRTSSTCSSPFATHWLHVLAPSNLARRPSAIEGWKLALGVGQPEELPGDGGTARARARINEARRSQESVDPRPRRVRAGFPNACAPKRSVFPPRDVETRSFGRCGETAGLPVALALPVPPPLLRGGGGLPPSPPPAPPPREEGPSQPVKEPRASRREPPPPPPPQAREPRPGRRRPPQEEEEPQQELEPRPRSGRREPSGPAGSGVGIRETGTVLPEGESLLEFPLSQFRVGASCPPHVAGSRRFKFVSRPHYYNPSAVNPLKYAEQMQKRRLLWKKSAEGDANSSSPEEKPASSCAKVWEKMTFAQDEGGKVTAKFRKLMGIRSEPPPDADPSSDPLLSKQEKLFHDLDQQYEAARLSTHTHRGVGLGYSSQMAAFFQQTNLTK